MTQFNYIGAEVARPDAPDKAAGKAIYIHDLERPGMLYGKIKFSDYAHARIKHIDTSRAEKPPRGSRGHYRLQYAGDPHRVYQG